MLSHWEHVCQPLKLSSSKHSLPGPKGPQIFLYGTAGVQRGYEATTMRWRDGAAKSERERGFLCVKDPIDSRGKGRSEGNCEVVIELNHLLKQLCIIRANTILSVDYCINYVLLVLILSITCLYKSSSVILRFWWKQQINSWDKNRSLK